MGGGMLIHGPPSPPLAGSALLEEARLPTLKVALTK
jgi:hypothetical protein